MLQDAVKLKWPLPWPVYDITKPLNQKPVEAL